MDIHVFTLMQESIAVYLSVAVYSQSHLLPVICAICSSCSGGKNAEFYVSAYFKV